MTLNAPSKARTDLETGWTRFMEDRNLKATVPGWETLTAVDGSPLLSGRVAGPGAGYALQRFVATGPIGLPRAGDTRPVVDYSVPGRTAYVWRSYGVWVELWVPDSAEAAQTPVQPALAQSGRVLDPIPVAARRAFLRGPGGRLAFTRKRRTTNPKETPAA